MKPSYDNVVVGGGAKTFGEIWPGAVVRVERLQQVPEAEAAQAVVEPRAGVVGEVTASADAPAE